MFPDDSKGLTMSVELLESLRLQDEGRPPVLSLDAGRCQESKDCASLLAAKRLDPVRLVDRFHRMQHIRETRTSPCSRPDVIDKDDVYLCGIHLTSQGSPRAKTTGSPRRLTQPLHTPTPTPP